MNEGIALRTYERGVEDETLSCGTGATAGALALVFSENRLGSFEVPVNVKGGDLSISGDFNGKTFTNVYLSGPAEKVFDGKISL
jgi:diaminopimelate epimerase